MASADILRAAHTPTPWDLLSSDPIWFVSLKDGKQEYFIGHCYGGAEPDVSGRSNAAFIVRACNAHYQMLEALKALDAWWADSFPAGPDAEDISYGFGKLSEGTLAIWRQVRAAIAAAEAEAGR